MANINYYNAEVVKKIRDDSIETNNKLEIKTTLQIGFIADDLSRFSRDGKQKWVSVESILKVLKGMEFRQVDFLTFDEFDGLINELENENNKIWFKVWRLLLWKMYEYLIKGDRMNNIKLKVNSPEQNMQVQKKVKELNRERGHWNVFLNHGFVNAIDYVLRAVYVSRNWSGFEYLVIDKDNDLILCTNKEAFDKRQEKEVSFEEFIGIDNNKIKLEVGKSYKNKNGEVVKIVALTSHPLFKFIDSDNSTYTENGRLDYGVTEYDLIEEFGGVQDTKKSLSSFFNFNEDVFKEIYKKYLINILEQLNYKVSGSGDWYHKGKNRMKTFEETHPSLVKFNYIIDDRLPLFVVQKHTIDKAVLKKAFDVSDEWWEDMWQDDLDSNEIIESYKKEVFKNLGLEEE